MEKIVVACKDFTVDGKQIQDFTSLKNQVINLPYNGYGTDLNDVLNSINEQNAIDSLVVTERFWDMFIVDALIANCDRHNGNWGFLYDLTDDKLTLAPVYDCGSSLYSQADENVMKKVLSNKNEQNIRIYDIPTSSLTINDKRIKYYDFINSLKNEDCNKALLRIVPKINLGLIVKIVNNIPCISELQKNFYINMICLRKEKILDKAYNLLTKKNT